MTREDIKKIVELEKIVSAERGSFILFGIFKRTDLEDKWDIIACADWIKKKDNIDLKYFFTKVSDKIKNSNFLARIILMDETDDYIKKLLNLFEVEHSEKNEYKDLVVDNELTIKQCYIITAKKQNKKRNRTRIAPKVSLKRKELHA